MSPGSSVERRAGLARAGLAAGISAADAGANGSTTQPAPVGRNTIADAAGFHSDRSSSDDSFLIFVRRDVLRLGGASLRLMLGAIILSIAINLLYGAAFWEAVLLHPELVFSVVIFLSIVIFGYMLAEHKRAEEQALQDPLTGLPNRILFMDKLRRADARVNRRGDYLFAVLFLDLDRFKHLNDRLGHAVGDRFLTETARRLRATVRPGDTVARLGGDEFAVLVEDLTGRDEAERLAQRLKEQLAEPCTLNGQVVFTSTSIGVGLSGNGRQRGEDLLSDADTAMYRAKAALPASG